MNSSTVRSPLTVFCGKGGVGKTTISLAYGLWQADRGVKVVVVTSHPIDELAVSVSLQGLKEQHPRAAANLFVVHIDPREILGNKVRQQIPSEFVARKVLSSTLYQNLVEVAPGLKEIAFLARLRQLADRQTQEGDRNGYDLLIWDAPATGHFLQTLKVSRNFESYMSGPFSVLGGELLNFLSDPANIRLIPVTTLEEMAVVETIALCGELRAELHMQPSDLICNLASPLMGCGEEYLQDLYRILASGGPKAEEMRFVLDRHSNETGLYRKLRSAVQAVFHAVPRIPRWNSDLELLVCLGNLIGGKLGNAAI